MAAPGPGGGATGSLLFFSPRSALSAPLVDSALYNLNRYYISSSATATQSSTGTVPIPNNPLNTKLFYLGSGITNASGEAGGWYASETSSFSGSFHDRLFWMYGNSSTFQTDYSNLYYITFQTRSLTTTTFTSGAIYPLASKAEPPVIAPSYGYFLNVGTDGSTISFATTDSPFFIQDGNKGITFDPATNDSLRSGSSIAGGILNQWTASSGTYNFVRGNFPSNTITPVRALPIEITCSFININTGGGTTAAEGWRVSLISGSTVIASSSVFPGGSFPVDKTVNFRLDIYSGSSINADPLLAKSSTLGNTASIGPNSDNTKIKFRIEPFESLGSGTYTIEFINISINQPMSGRQVAFEVPLINIFNPTNTPPATANDTGSYYVITPNLRAVDNVQVGGLPQSNFIGAIYYFKTAYHLWRDAWQVQSAEGGPICPQDVWISASSNPSWAAYDAGLPVTIGSVVTRNGGWLYASRSVSPLAFIDYGTSSTDAAVRNRSYVGITAELLGGSELIKHLKGNAAGTISASFPGNKFGGMIVVKASNVSTDSTTAADRYFPGTTNPPYPSTFIWYKPGASGVTSTYNNIGLPFTEVNNGDVVPFSNFGYEHNPGVYSPQNSNMDWPTSISWPPANPYSYDPG